MYSLIATYFCYLSVFQLIAAYLVFCLLFQGSLRAVFLDPCLFYFYLFIYLLISKTQKGKTLMYKNQFSN